VTKLHSSVGDENILNKYGFGKDMHELVLFALLVWGPSQRVGQNKFTLHSTVMMFKFRSDYCDGDSVCQRSFLALFTRILKLCLMGVTIVRIYTQTSKL